MKYSKWVVPRRIVTATESAFRVGKHEVFAMWTARLATEPVGDTAEVLRCIVPAQSPGVSATGVWVHIAGQELQRIQLDNYARQERSVIQLHTHPGSNVEMSRLDREWEVVRHVGALSIIVPFYARDGMCLHDGANVYERDEQDWRLWSRAETSERLVVA